MKERYERPSPKTLRLSLAETSSVSHNYLFIVSSGSLVSKYNCKYHQATIS